MFSDIGLSRQGKTKLCESFGNVRTNIDDDYWQGRPSQSRTDDNVDAFTKCCLQIEETTIESGRPISQRSVHYVISEIL